MFPGLIDYKNSLNRKMFNQDRIDPGSFSMFENGWWVLHTAAIAGVFWIGYQMAKNRQ
ncbi:hypothetical protein [Syntrophomonas erecta]